MIVHHTVTSVDAKPERLAQGQVSQGKAGITYHFLISGDGTIYQTQLLDTATEQTLQTVANNDGIAVGLIGNFTAAVPGDGQMQATAHLIAWLLQEYRLPAEAVVGRSEIDTTVGSPGTQWLKSAQYKYTLLDAIKEFQQGPVDPVVMRLRKQVKDLTAEVARLKPLADQVELLKKQIAEQEREIERLKQALIVAGGGVPKPTLIDMVERLERHPSLPPYERRTQKISAILVHHAETPKTMTVEQIAWYHVHGERTNNRGELVKEQWPGIAYHYVIAPDGTIYQGQRHETRSYHAGNANDYSLAVSLIGSFMGYTEPPADRLPTPAQMRSAARLIAWLLQELKLPLESVMGHREVGLTDCPGDQWLSQTTWKNTLRQAIQTVQKGRDLGATGTIEHYLLFWDHENQWAESDWRNAQGYIARFRPTTGFSVDEAMLARHVVIVGGEAGVSGADEQRLRDAGVDVCRLAGANEAETKAKLDELVQRNIPWPGAPPRAVAAAPMPASDELLNDPWYIPAAHGAWQPPVPKKSTRRTRTNPAATATGKEAQR